MKGIGSLFMEVICSLLVTAYVSLHVNAFCSLRVKIIGSLIALAVKFTVCEVYWFVVFEGHSLCFSQVHRDPASDNEQLYKRSESCRSLRQALASRVAVSAKL